MFRRLGLLSNRLRRLINLLSTGQVMISRIIESFIHQQFLSSNWGLLKFFWWMNDLGLRFTVSFPRFFTRSWLLLIILLHLLQLLLNQRINSLIPIWLIKLMMSVSEARLRLFWSSYKIIAFFLLRFLTKRWFVFVKKNLWLIRGLSPFINGFRGRIVEHHS